MLQRPAKMIRTRFAPSPNGPLHLGHAYAAVVAHDLARERNGEFLLRIEDIDGTRSRPELAAEFLADLAWLGLRGDGEAVFQSRVPGAKTVAHTTLKGGHFVQEDSPGEIAALLDALVATLPQRELAE